jgi:Eukaryotic aspartyl protease
MESDMAKSKVKNPIRIPINNTLLGDDYTGKLYVGAQRSEVSLLLDTGSSTLAVEQKSYDPRKDPKAKVTNLVQEVAYGDGSNWIGSVVQTDMTVSASDKSIDLPGVAVAVAYHESVSMFGKAQGILGLAYQALDDAIDVHKPTVPPKYTPNDVRAGHRVFVEPYFTQLEKAGLVVDKYAFYTRRSVLRASADPINDPMNNGFLIIGGGEEAKDLYKGSFKTALVLSDDWYSVNLRQVIVGSADPIGVSPPTHQDQVPTNAIVDSGTNGLDLNPTLFEAILKKLTPAQAQLVRSQQTPAANVNLAQWPTLTFVLQGVGGDIRLDVTPDQYWQMDAFEVGNAYCTLWRGSDPQSILGLPLMNGYFTIFDGTANNGLGVVKFATAK